MTEPTKASVTYTTGTGAAAVESTLRFHSVVVEDHKISAEVTGFPAQTGFVVSNHSIVKNDVISIVGIVTDTPIYGTDTFHQFGLDNKKIAFATMRALVRNSTPCKVRTNLGTYVNVIFTGFSTKTDKDWVNAMQFKFTGEAIQPSTSKDSTTPALVAFGTLNDTAREARVTALANAGFFVDDTATISEAKVDLGGSFSLDSFNFAGIPLTTVFEHMGMDAASGKQRFRLHTSDIMNAIADVEERAISTITTYANNVDLPELPDLGMSKGASEAAACLSDRAVDSISSRASGYINTSSGYLKESIYGAISGIILIDTNANFGQLLPSFGTGCNVLSAVGLPGTIDELSEATGLPTVEESVAAATEVGTDVVFSAITTITRITQPITTALLGDQS